MILEPSCLQDLLAELENAMDGLSSEEEEEEQEEEEEEEQGGEGKENFKAKEKEEEEEDVVCWAVPDLPTPRNSSKRRREGARLP